MCLREECQGRVSGEGRGKSVREVEGRRVEKEEWRGKSGEGGLEAEGVSGQVPTPLRFKSYPSA